MTAPICRYPAPEPSPSASFDALPEDLRQRMREVQE